MLDARLFFHYSRTIQKICKENALSDLQQFYFNYIKKENTVSLAAQANSM